MILGENMGIVLKYNNEDYPVIPDDFRHGINIAIDTEVRERYCIEKRLPFDWQIILNPIWFHSSRFSKGLLTFGNQIPTQPSIISDGNLPNFHEAIVDEVVIENEVYPNNS